MSRIDQDIIEQIDQHDKDIARQRFAKKRENKVLDDQKRIHKKMKAHFEKQHVWPLRDENKKGRKI